VDIGQHVRVGVYDLLGRRVALLFEGVLEGGQRLRLTFDGGGLPSGVYLLRAEGERFADVQRITLLK
jgi:hypothetical protein